MRNPFQTLGVPVDADDAAIHSAYLQEVQKHPPEKDAQRFQEARRAYEAIRTRRLRLRYELFHSESPTFDEILERGLTRTSFRRPTEDAFRRALAASVAGRAASKSNEI